METNTNVINSSQRQVLNNPQRVLLKWMQITMLFSCGLVLIFILLFNTPKTQTTIWYMILVSTVMVLLGVAHYFYRRKYFIVSSRLLVLSGVIGPWGSVFIDPSIAHGNLIPLIYLTIPILFSSFFSTTYFTTIVGGMQFTGLTLFILTQGINLTASVSSLCFYMFFIFASSLIYNYQNRHNQSQINSYVKKLNELAISDPLTGLYNRYFLDEYLKKEFEKLKRRGGELALILFDIDDFKLFNDRFGHECGDSILVGLSNLLTENFRKSDIICRYGGDEFLIVMNDSNVQEAQKKCRNLQNLITERNLSCRIDADMPPTLSIGIAQFAQDFDNIEELINAADQALYLAKEKGKSGIETGPSVGKS